MKRGYFLMGLLLIALSCQFLDPEVNFTIGNHVEEMVHLVENIPLEENHPGILFQDEEREYSESDLLYFSLSSLNPDESWEEFSPQMIGQIPSSLRNLSQVNSRSVFLPIQIDHVELALTKDLLERFPQELSGFFSLEILEGILESQVTTGHFPLLVAGGEDQNLMDFLVAMILSQQGPEAAKQWISFVTANDPTEESLASLEHGFLLTSLERLTDYRQKGILHPEWMRLTNEDVENFADAGITSAIVMRLSTHRTFDFNTIRNYRAYPFPMSGEAPGGPAITALIYGLAIPQASGQSREALILSRNILSQQRIGELTADTGLAPASSTAPALDRQSSDVRLWAAGSRDIVSPPAAPPQPWVQLIREYLGQ